MKEIILVGNSSNILNMGLGSYIDSFENVIRFNRFKIKDFEKDLGKKCTHWILNYKLTTDNRKYLTQNLNKIKSLTTDLNQILILTTSKDNGEINKISKKLNIELIYKQYPQFFNYKPTTGFLTIKYFLDIFPQLTLIGFDFGKSNHYWGNHGISDVPGKHEWDKEKKYIDTLVEQNKIEII
tara:strand:- start:256 stop:801 length:546 start_codon:yes stop_codon:yes gene_type:complete